MNNGRLPPELVQRIFKIIQETENDGEPYFEWYKMSTRSYQIFDTVSLVCREWRELAMPFRSTFIVASKPPSTPNEVWTGTFEHNGDKIASIVPIQHLVVRAESTARYALPYFLPSYLLAAEDTLVSLSVDACLFDPYSHTGSRHCGKALSRLYRNVTRLHIYSVPGSITVFDNGTILGFNIPWSDLAKSIWLTRRTKPLKELSLSGIAVDCMQDFSLDHCPAEFITLDNIWFRTRQHSSQLFPNAKKMIFPSNGLSPISRGALKAFPTYNLVLDSYSQSLLSLHVTWLVDPLQGNNRISAILEFDSTVLKSSNL